MIFKGATIKKISGAGPASGAAEVRQLDPIDDPRAYVQFTLVDAQGKPVVNEPFKVELPDGSVKRGRTDAGGRAAIPGPRQGTAKVTFTEIDAKAIEEGR